MIYRITQLLRHFGLSRPGSWRNIEYFNKKWKVRIEKMSAFLDPNCSVVDLGCGRMWLREYLPKSVRYFPVDYEDRGAECIVQDFNQYQYPDVDADTAFVSGCLEYVNDPSWFISEVCKHQVRCVLSYCTTEFFPEGVSRQRKSWVNSLSEAEVVDLFGKHGFELQHKTIEQTYVIFVFTEPAQ